jgi:hypothetical protein
VYCLEQSCFCSFQIAAMQRLDAPLERRAIVADAKTSRGQ